MYKLIKSIIRDLYDAHYRIQYYLKNFILLFKAWFLNVL